MFLISESLLADATFQMLASSTIKRYLRIAREFAQRAGLIQATRTNPEIGDQALERARKLWTTVRGASGRAPEEFELGLLLVALNEGHYEPAEELLLQVASSDDATGTWSIALARRLRELGPQSREA